MKDGLIKNFGVKRMMHYLIFFNTNALSMWHSVKTLGGRQKVTDEGFALKKPETYDVISWIICIIKRHRQKLWLQCPLIGAWMIGCFNLSILECKSVLAFINLFDFFMLFFTTQKSSLLQICSSPLDGEFHVKFKDLKLKLETYHRNCYNKCFYFWT